MTIIALPDLTGYAPHAERWHAFDDDTYDGAPDAGPQIVGYGATAEEAIANYLQLVEEELADRILAQRTIP